MNILRIYQKVPPNPGGMEQHILQLSKEQIKAGCNVTLAFYSGNRLSQQDIIVSQLNLLTKVKPQVMSNCIFYLILLFKLLFNKKKYDVVHIHGDWSAFIFAKLIKKVVNANCVLGSFHGKLNMSRLNLIRYSYSKLDALYTTGLSEYEYLSDILSIPVRWYHSGVDESFYQNRLEVNADSRIVLTVGSCLPVKNIDFMIEVARIMPTTLFKHIGGGPLFNSFKNKTEKLSNISFLGPKNRNEVIKAMEEAKVFLLTSIDEGTPTVILEAMVKNCFIVTSNSCNLSTIIGDKDGVVINDFNVKEYAHEISIFLGKQQNKSKKQCFSWKEVAEKITSFTKEVEKLSKAN